MGTSYENSVRNKLTSSGRKNRTDYRSHVKSDVDGKPKLCEKSALLKLSIGDIVL